MPDADVFASHMARVARAILGEPNAHLSRGGELRFGSHGSLSVDTERGVFFDHENGVGGGVLDLIRTRQGHTNGAALDWLRDQGLLAPCALGNDARQRFQLGGRAWAGQVSRHRPPVRHEDVVVAPPASADHGAAALRIWEDARAPSGTPVEAYLAGRGLALPSAGAEVVRYHPACPFAGTRTPAVVALVRDVVNDRPVGIHRTALDRRGCKVAIEGKDRLALGPIRAGAVKLTPDADVTTCLGVGEGIESTLSLQALPEFGRSPVWALLNAGGIAALPVLAAIECLWIAVDHDPAGIAAADLASHRWQRAGREVLRVRAVAERADLNDVVGGAP